MNIYPIVRKEYNAQQCCAHLRKSLYFVRKVLLRVVLTGIIRDLSEVTYLISTLLFFFFHWGKQEGHGFWGSAPVRVNERRERSCQGRVKHLGQINLLIFSPENVG